MGCGCVLSVILKQREKYAQFFFSLYFRIGSNPSMKAILKIQPILSRLHTKQWHFQWLQLVLSAPTKEKKNQKKKNTHVYDNIIGVLYRNPYSGLLIVPHSLLDRYHTFSLKRKKYDILHSCIIEFFSPLLEKRILIYTGPLTGSYT